MSICVCASLAACGKNSHTCNTGLLLHIIGLHSPILSQISRLNYNKAVNLLIKKKMYIFIFSCLLWQMTSSRQMQSCVRNLSSNSTVNKDDCCKTHWNYSCWLAVFSNTGLKALQSTHVKVNRLLLWTFLGKLIAIPLGVLFCSAIVCLHYLKPISGFSWL